MKKIICISPHFPPVNAADMHRLRQSLPYFQEFGWEPIVFYISPDNVEQAQDPVLGNTVPDTVELHKVDAYPANITRKVSLGNLGFRCWFQLKRAVDKYLARNKCDLVYFSTTVFTVMSLGPHWLKKYGVPFVIDLQDPWRNDYYLSLPKSEQPNKFWFDYRQKKILEAYTMPKAAGIVSVSPGYVKTIKSRYPVLADMECLTLPFAAFTQDMEQAKLLHSRTILSEDTVEFLYIGRGGLDMEFSLSALFAALRKGLDEKPAIFDKLRFTFIGTSYAPTGKGVLTILPIAVRHGVQDHVSEQTDRIPYYEALNRLANTDYLLMPGSDDADYTASKIFPYIMAQKPLLAIFNKHSSVVDILAEANCEAVTFTKGQDFSQLFSAAYKRLEDMLTMRSPIPSLAVLDKYSAERATQLQCAYFERQINRISQKGLHH